LITKDRFIEIINGINDAETFWDKLNAFVQANGISPYIEYPDCEDLCVDLLQDMFDDKEEAISWYCFEKGLKDTSFKRENGEYVQIKSAEDLFDYLTLVREE
jgi:hypothetical protein